MAPAKTDAKKNRAKKLWQTASGREQSRLAHDG